jgi:hypothetical protein
MVHSNTHYAFLFLQARIVFVCWTALQVPLGLRIKRGQADARAWSPSRGMTEGRQEEEDAVGDLN